MARAIIWCIIIYITFNSSNIVQMLTELRLMLWGLMAGVTASLGIVTLGIVQIWAISAGVLLAVGVPLMKSVLISFLSLSGGE